MSKHTCSTQETEVTPCSLPTLHSVSWCIFHPYWFWHRKWIMQGKTVLKWTKYRKVRWGQVFTHFCSHTESVRKISCHMRILWKERLTVYAKVSIYPRPFFASNNWIVFKTWTLFSICLKIAGGCSKERCKLSISAPLDEKQEDSAGYVFYSHFLWNRGIFSYLFGIWQAQSPERLV